MSIQIEKNILIKRQLVRGGYSQFPCSKKCETRLREKKLIVGRTCKLSITCIIYDVYLDFIFYITIKFELSKSGFFLGRHLFFFLRHDSIQVEYFSKN